MTHTELELRAAAIAYINATADFIDPKTWPAAKRLLEAVKASQRKEEEWQPDQNLKRIADLEKELAAVTAHRNRLIDSSMEAWSRIDDQS